jgi:hypothetical protein
MPRTRKIKLLDEQDEKELYQKLANDVADTTTNRWDRDISNVLNKINDHVKKGGSFHCGWNNMFDLIFNYSSLGRYYDSKKAMDIIYNYSRNTLKDRLPRSESNNQEAKFLLACSKNWRLATIVAKYARYVVRGKLDEEIENEIEIQQCGKYVFWLKNQGLEYESLLMKSTFVAYQFYCVNFWIPDNVHNYMIASKLGGDTYARSYFKERTKCETLLKSMLANVDQTQTIADLVKKIGQ